jgi:hypothetical protein
MFFICNLMLQFVSGVLRELSVCLCKWNHQLDCCGSSIFVRDATSSVGLSVHAQRLVIRSTRFV